MDTNSTQIPGSLTAAREYLDEARRALDAGDERSAWLSLDLAAIELGPE